MRFITKHDVIAVKYILTAFYGRQTIFHHFEFNIKCGYYELDISPLTRFDVKYSAAYVETTALFYFLLFGVRVFLYV